jgi:hypothetical protein
MPTKQRNKMANIYRIKPLEKKSVEVYYDVYSINEMGTVRGFTITETYRWGFGFRDLDNAVDEWDVEHGVVCDPQIGWGTDAEDLCACYFDFDDSFTEQERAEIEAAWEDGGAGWLYDGEHNWLVEEDSVKIYGPVQVDLVDEDGYGDTGVIEKNIPIVKRQVVMPNNTAAWPFPTK